MPSLLVSKFVRETVEEVEEVRVGCKKSTLQDKHPV